LTPGVRLTATLDFSQPISRARLLAVEIESLLPLHWRKHFYDEINFDEPLEFDNGDAGPAGGVQVCPCNKSHEYARLQQWFVQRIGVMQPLWYVRTLAAAVEPYVFVLFETGA
jgi:hypothetical protein